MKKRKQSELTVMPIIDLSHTISEATPVYPGTEAPIISTPCTIDRQGFTEKRLNLFSHTGTHMDAPAHILRNGKTLDRFSLNHFTGRAVVADLTGIAAPEITIRDLQPYETQLSRVEFLILHTGWYQKWGDAAYFSNFPVLTTDAARWLAGFRLRGIGMDMISIDRTDTATYPIHRIFLEKEVLIIENLTNLAELPDAVFTFYCFPLKIQDADGSPVRACAENPEATFSLQS